MAKPCYQDFDSIKYDAYTEDLHPWEIAAPVDEKDSILIWCIVLGYLLQKTNLNEKKFNKHLTIFKTEKLIESGRVQQILKNFNPFQQGYRYFDSQELVPLVSALEVEVRKKCGENPTDSDIIESACSVLSCSIYVIDKLPSVAKYRTVPNSSSLDHKQKEKITLYMNKDGYRFGLSQKMGNELQTKALKQISRSLGSDSRTDVIQFLIDQPSYRKSLVVSLLCNKKTDILAVLYSLPANILKQLDIAAINLDPTLEVDGKSAFYYAFWLLMPRTLHLLYRFATKAFQWTEYNPRTPNQDIIEILNKLSKALIKTKNQWIEMDSSVLSPIVHIDEVIVFNEFQLSLCAKLCSLPETKICRSDSFCLLIEVKKRKDILFAILKEYADRFYKKPFSAKEPLSLDSYQRYINYFTRLDKTAATFIFDHEFLLKDSLVLADRSAFDVMESSLIEFICLTCYSYNQLLSKTDTLTANFKIEYDKTKFDFLLRGQFYEQLKNFETQLKDIDITADDIKKHAFGDEVHTLTTNSVLKDSLLLLRLEYFMNSAIELDLDENKEIGPFVIERALQVLGECINNTDVTDSCTLIKSLLSSYFSKNNAKNFIGIRNLLSHNTSKQTHNRLDMERNEIELFKEMQSELQIVMREISYCFTIQNSIFRKYVCKRITKLMEPDINLNQHAQQFLTNETPKDQLEREHNLEVTLSKYKNKFALHLKNMKDWIKTSYKIENLKQENIAKKFDCKFASIKVLLQFLLKVFGTVEDQTRFINDIEPTNSDRNIEKRNFIEKRLESYSLTVNNVLERLEIPVLNDDLPGNISDYKISKKFHHRLQGCILLSKAEKRQVLLSIPEDNEEKLNHNIFEAISGEIHQHRTWSSDEIDELGLSSNELKEKLKKILAPGTKKKLKKLNNFIEAHDNYRKLKDRLQDTPFTNKKQSINHADLFEQLGIKEYVNDLLKDKLENSSNSGGKLEILSDRINRLSRLIKAFCCDGIIDDRGTIAQLLFLNEKEKPASKIAVESFLFDCIVILREVHKDDAFEYLYRKMNGLFKGIDFRNVLAHGNPLYEAAVKILDKRDEVNEIIDIVLELIESKDSIQAMCELRSNTGFESGTFSKIIESFEQLNEMKESIVIIKQCKRWQEYANQIFKKEIIAHDPGDEKAIDEINKFMSTVGYKTGDVSKLIDSYESQRDLIEKIKTCDVWKSFAVLSGPRT